MANTGSIKMNPAELATRANQFSQRSTEIAQLNQAITSSVSELTSSWSGASSQAFANQWTQISPRFKEAAQLLADISTQLKSISQTMQEQDAQIAQQIGY